MREHLSRNYVHQDGAQRLVCGKNSNFYNFFYSQIFILKKRPKYDAFKAINSCENNPELNIKLNTSVNVKRVLLITKMKMSHQVRTKFTTLAHTVTPHNLSPA